MKKKLTSRFITIGLSLTMVLSVLAMPSWAYAATDSTTIDKTLKDTAKAMYSNTEAQYGYEWNIFDLARYGGIMSSSFLKNYHTSVSDYAKKEEGVLSERKYTEYEKLIIAYTAAGLNPTDVGGYNMLKPLADFDKTVWQGVNSAIFALIALDSGCYTIPKLTASQKSAGATQTTRARLIQYILDKQLPDGGWDIAGRAADPDMTGMALQALAPYYSGAKPESTKTTTEVTASIVSKVNLAANKAIGTMAAFQKEDGSFASYGVSTAESTVQVLTALSALGIDAQKDSRFIKGGQTVVDDLMTYYDSKACGFRHVNEASAGYEATVNGMATYEGFYALMAYDRFTDGKSSLYTVKAPGRGSGLGLANLPGKRVKVSWAAKTGANGYQIQYATNSKFTAGKKTVTIKSGSAKTKTLSGFAKKKYYVKVRAFKEVAGVRSYSSWSSVKTVTVKK
ncbi:MAG TPA: hypothetical protein VJY37_01760 [Anaerovoracaceae bacterium]|nr:hypothetical protein [Anaerovoracaceae bacterium]